MRLYPAALRLLPVIASIWAGSLHSFGQVVLSEFMASNTQTLTDEDGEYADWIELLNAGSTNVNLNGWSLTDDPAAPRKWRFPSVDLAAGQTLLVFASNKDRRIPGNPLHTDFRLSASGDYLALSNPQGVVASEFAPAYPPQLPDVSFGIVAEARETTLVASGARSEILIPGDGSLEGVWNLAETPPGNWIAATNGIGFDRNPPAPAEAWVAAVSALAPTLWLTFDQPGGVTITNSGASGAAGHGAAVGGLTYNQPGVRPSDFPGLAVSNVGLRFDGRDDYVAIGGSPLNDLAGFTMSAWIKPAILNRPRSGLWGQHGVVEFGFIDDTLLQLSSPAGGTVQANYPYRSNEWRHVTATGDGESLRIYLDGVLAAEGGNRVPLYGSSLYQLNLAGGGIFDPAGNFFNGYLDEFAMFPRALGEDEIAQLYRSAKTPDATYHPVLASDLGNAMDGRSSLYARFPFGISGVQFSPLILRLGYDDGFTAFLNGVEVARRNAPSEPIWNSAATADRPRAAGLLPGDFDITASAGLLHEGANVLAIQILNSSAADPDLFLRAQLIGAQSAIQTNSLRYFVQPTPGALNGAGESNLGPLVLDAKHSPELPGDSDAIQVTARMVRTFNPPATLSLTYRAMFGAESTLQMADNGLHGDGAAGDGVFGATLPATLATRGQMVRWFFRATDNQGLVTRWPPYRDPRNSPQYLGTVIADPGLTNPLPVLHWFIQSASGADSSAGARCSVFWDGVLYDNVFANLHGQSSQGFPKKSYNFDFNRGFKFQYSAEETPVEDINLLTTYPDKAHLRNVLAYETFRDAGHAYHFVIPVRVQRNGAFFSDAHLVEDAEEEYLTRVGLDPRGALYKMYNTLDSANSNVEKKTRKYEGNNDLQRLINGLNLTGAARSAFVYDNIDLPGMANYLAALIVTGNVDCCHKNYYLYRDSAGNGEWQFLPWDVDLSFGRNWTGAQTYFDDTMYTSNPLFIGQNNRLPSVLFGIPAFRQMYLRRVRTLMDELLQPPGTPAGDLKYEKRIRELAAAIAPDAALDFAKWPTWGIKQTMPQALAILTNQYFPGRRNYLFVNQRNSIPGPIANPAPIDFGPLEFNPPSGLQSQEYFTLANPSRALSVDLSGWTVEGAVDYTFSPGMVLATNMTVYLSPDVNAFRLRTESPKGGESRFVQGNYRGQLSARGETLVLKNKSGGIVSTLAYPGAPTFAQQYLRVSEVMFAPPAAVVPGILAEDLEYIVLKNIGPTPLDLRGIAFDDGISFNLATNLFLPPQGEVYLAKNPDAFARNFGTGFPVIGPYLGQLANSGETVSLYDSAGEKVQDFRFDTAWLTNRPGHSLVSVSDATPYAELDRKTAWVPSAYRGGSAGAQLAWDAWRAANFPAGDSLGAPGLDADGDGHSNYHEFVFGTAPRDPASVFRVDAARADGVFRLRFPAAPGRAYSIVGSGDLKSWSEIATLPRASAAQLQDVALPAGPGANSFYQVRARF